MIPRILLLNPACVAISLAKENGTTRRVLINEWLRDKAKDAALASGHWLFKSKLSDSLNLPSNQH